MPVPQSRTQWAERQAEELLSVPFIAEFVLRSPQMIDGTQKEVADLLILYKDGNLLVSQKAQEDPLSRNQQKNELWVLKAAKNGVSQLCGALRSSTRAMWCQHPRRGRVDFPTGIPAISHGIVTVETYRPVDLEAAAAEVPLTHCGTPLTYISLSDFMNVAIELRTVPELLRYLNARRELPDAALHDDHRPRRRRVRSCDELPGPGVHSGRGRCAERCEVVWRPACSAGSTGRFLNRAMSLRPARIWSPLCDLQNAFSVA